MMSRFLFMSRAVSNDIYSLILEHQLIVFFIDRFAVSLLGKLQE